MLFDRRSCPPLDVRIVPWRDSIELAEFIAAGSKVLACEMLLDAVKMLLPLDMVRVWLLWLLLLLLLLLVPLNCSRKFLALETRRRDIIPYDVATCRREGNEKLNCEMSVRTT